MSHLLIPECDGGDSAPTLPRPHAPALSPYREWGIEDERELRRRCPWLRPADGELDALAAEMPQEPLSATLRDQIAASVADDPVWWGRLFEHAIDAARRDRRG